MALSADVVGNSSSRLWASTGTHRAQKVVVLNTFAW
jgi:hypothetical protein